MPDETQAEAEAAVAGTPPEEAAPATPQPPPSPATPEPPPAPADTAPADTAPAVAPEPVARPPLEAAPAPQPAPAPVERPAVVLTAETLARFAPRAKPEFVTVLAGEGNAVLTRFGINRNPKRFCHFMAQVAHECVGFTVVEENLNYSAARMVQVFGPGKHSAAITAGEARRLAGNRQAFAERVYGLGNPRKARDLGNTEPGDGYRYRGRGFMQITGRAAYREMGRKIGVDLEGNPDLAAQPLYALMTAAAFWDGRRLNDYADQDNIEIITKRINGGHNGLPDRKARFSSAQRIWAAAAAAAAVGRSLDGLFVGRRPLEYGDLRPEVLDLKRLLASAGYDGFAMDQDFGRATHLAVVRFQLAHGLPGDGRVDEATWHALERQGAPARAVVPHAEEARRARRRGRAVVAWAVLLLLAAAGVAAARLLRVGLAAPASRWEWIVLGFAGLVAAVALVLIALGAGIARAARARRPLSRDAGEFDELGVRPDVNP
jgi:putative chitinase